MKSIKFWLNDCDIAFVAEAPADITLEKLLTLADKIKPDYCACGIKSFGEKELNYETDIIFCYDSVCKTNDDVACSIIE